MTTAKAVIAIALGCGATGGFLSWRYLTFHNLTLSQVVEVLDRSESVTELDRGAQAMLRRSLELSGMRKGSSVTVLATGDATTANEPVLMVRYEVPVSRQALERKAAALACKEEIIGDLAARLKNLRRTRVSPIFIAVKRGVEQLRARGCTPDTPCYLFVKTDGEELADPGIREALRGRASKGKLPALIHNEGIKVIFCGISETAGEVGEGGIKQSYTQIREAGLDRVRDVWMRLFASPEAVSFEPFCDGVEIAKK